MGARNFLSQSLAGDRTGGMATAAVPSRRPASLPLCGLLYLLTAGGPAHGAGLGLREFGSPLNGSASAGWAALGEDASTAATNPAAMTRLERSEFLAGAQLLVVDIKFDTEQSSFGGGNGGNAGGAQPAGGLFYVHKVNPDLALGLSASSFLGLGFEFDNDWAGRYHITKGELVTMAAGPSIGYRLNDRWSVGGGVFALYGDLDQRAAINNGITDPGTPDGQIKFQQDDWAVGGTLGVLYEPQAGTRFGLNARSKAELELEDAVRVRGLGSNLNTLLSLTGILGSEIDMEMTLPRAVTLSGYHALNDKLALMGNLGWENWSEFGQVGITLNSTTARSFEQDRNFKDTWHVALGARYRYRPQWILSAGLAYDSSPVDDHDRTIDLPLDRQIRVGVGAEYEKHDDFVLGFGYVYLNAGDAEIDQSGGPLTGDIKGEFDRNAVHFFNVNARWRF
jgi:long-chain fatty acid transport protein